MDKHLHRLEIEPAENGGHVVRHHHREISKNNKSHSGISVYSEPETHVFGPDEGHEMLAHVANHLHIAEPKEEEREDDEDNEEGEE